jgi:uncharacterized protein
MFARKTAMKRLFLVLFALAFAVCAYAMFIEPFRLKVTEWTVQNEKWTYDRPLRIAILTDIHLIWPWMTPSHLARIVDRANDLNPDMIVLLGDYVALHPFGLQIAPAEALAPLKHLSAPCGVYAVGGDHDGVPNGNWFRTLMETGITVLHYRHVTAKCQGMTFQVIGPEGPWWKKPDIDAAFAAIPEGMPVIVPMHTPDLFPDIPSRAALTMAGNTHGGQVIVPFYGAIAAEVPSKYGLKYLHGHFNEDGRDLVVSSGVGMSRFPVRFGVVPEIALVTLQKSKP